MLALDAAKSAGADYADVRFVRNRNQNVSTREQRVSGVSDNETYGFGVRTLVNGAWGFAASRELTRDEVTRVAKQAVAQARANRAALVRPVVLAPARRAANGTWKSPIEIDPFDVPIEDKVALLLAANEAALKVQGRALRELEHVLPARGEDVRVHRRHVHRADDLPHAAVDDRHRRVGDTATSRRASRTTSRRAGSATSTCAMRSSSSNAPKWADEAVQKLTAKSVDVGRYDLVLHPSHLWLTIHESIAHPTELDRAMGYEANYAGTSFVAPPEKVLGKLKYGSELMNIQGDRTQDGSLVAHAAGTTKA